MTADRAAWIEGARLLQSRVDAIPGLLSEWVLGNGPVLTSELAGELDFDPRAVRRWVVTGIGSSAAHARFLAHWLGQRTSVAARFASTGSLAAGAPPGAEADGLIVFSQGLSPNARFALAHIADWCAVVLVTAVQPKEADPPDSAAGFAARCQHQGVSIVALPEAARDEYQTLVRVIGPALGYTAAIALVRTLAGATSFGHNIPELSAPELLAGLQSASASASRLFPDDESLAASFGHETVLLAAGGYGEMVQNLRGKLLEGMGQPQPPLWDLLEFAHGGFQRIHDRKATLIALAPGDDTTLDGPLLEGLRNMLHPERHDLRVLRASLPAPWSIFEHEAVFNELMLRWQAERERDPRRWPGKGKDAALYQQAPATPPATPADFAGEKPRWSALEDRSWPELERALAAGRRTAVIALGSTEQHGPHLPFATDTWIAQALAERFCARVPEALRLPTVSLGCASEHLAFPGTLSLSEDALEHVLTDLLAPLTRHGFEQAFVFSAHGGNLAALRAMEPRLRSAADPLRVIVYAELDELVASWHRASAAFGVSPEQSGHHAGEFETSIVAALRPWAVRWEQAGAGYTEKMEDAQRLFYPSLRENAPNGVVGDPRGAQAARGERYLELWTDALIERYRG